jgi:AAA lid domain/ATPase family associated with various cellular activities (AAA)
MSMNGFSPGSTGSAPTGVVACDGVVCGKEPGDEPVAADEPVDAPGVDSAGTSAVELLIEVSSAHADITNPITISAALTTLDVADLRSFMSGPLERQPSQDGCRRVGARGVACDPMSSPMERDVAEFIDGITDELAALSGRVPAAHVADAVIEASNLVAALIAADGRLTDSELDGYLDSIGPLLDPPLITSALHVRETDLFKNRQEWLDQPSVLFDLLVQADRKRGTRRSNRYYELALRLAHVTAATDLVPSLDEVQAIDAYRTRMLQAMDAAGVARPGQPDHPRPQPTPAAAAAATPATTTVDAELPPARSVSEVMAELDSLIGLDNVKAEVRRLTSMLQVQQIRAERGLPVIEISHHLVFTGNPGTGKTTVARLLGQIYRAIGVVSKGQLVETDRSKLVAGFVGQTALKTLETLQASLGGMLLIDEAYALARGGDNDFGREAIDTLVKFMEDHRDDLSIVAAGYTEEMADFIDANPGLKSRFTRTISFPDYTDDELVAIFLALGEKSQYACSDDALARVRHFISAEPRTRGFGNARFVRNLFETAIAHQAQRVAPLGDPSDEQLTTLTASDIAAVDA